jgi:RecA-family ATPase
MAIAAVLSSEGGLGKTNLILHLAACVVTGRDWLGYPVDPSQIGRHCCLVLAEEKQDEVLRRLWQIAEHLQLTQDERELVLERVVVLALSGQPCSFTALDGDGIPRRTGNFRAFLSRLASGPEWALVALDPLARLFPSAESSNELATYAVQCVEAISEAPGCPLALLSHHSSKIARRLGGVDARGVTGLTDGARWALTLLSKEDAQVELRQSKANYSPQQEKPLLLQREPGGLLRLSTAQEAEEKVAAAQDTAQTGLQKDAEKVVRYLRANGTMPLRLLAVKLAMGKARAGAALDEALRLHWITRHRAGPATGYTVASDLELDLYGFENGGFQ